MRIRNKIVLACVLGMATVGTTMPVYADNAGTFTGGVFATKVLTNMSERTEAEQQQAAAARYQASQSARPVQSAHIIWCY